MHATPSTFVALRTGTPPGFPYPLSLRPLGDVLVPSGRLEVSDAFSTLGEGVVVPVPPGAHPVVATMAAVPAGRDGTELRSAFVSVVVGEGEVARVEVVPPPGGGPGAAFVEANASMVGFADATAAATGMPEGDWLAEVFGDGTDGGWFARLDDPAHLGEGAANVPLPLARGGENVVMARSGWGHGVYPVVRTLDADGRLLGVHVDCALAAGHVPGPVDATPPDVTFRGLGARVRRWFTRAR